MPSCSLCKKSVPQLSKSHIIPNFILSFVRSKKSGRSMIIKGAHSARESQFNWHERLLCSDCESYLSENLEVPLKHVLFKKPSAKNSKLLSISADIDKIRGVLLSSQSPKVLDSLLSILWRASISNIEAYKHIKLPEFFEEILRLQLITANASKSRVDNYFSVRIIKILFPEISKETQGAMIVQPVMIYAQDDLLVFQFVIGRYAVLYFLHPNGVSGKTTAGLLPRLKNLRRHSRYIRYDKLPFQDLSTSKNLIDCIRQEQINRGILNL